MITSGLYRKGITDKKKLGAILEELKHEKVIKNNKKISYYNFPAAFDIETTSFYDKGEKRAIMYEWTLGLNGYVFVGRTWKEFCETCDLITERLELSEEKRLILWVHNLAFEYQFLQHYFVWDRVFAIDDRKPVQAVTNLGIEFRCSYILSNYGLAMLGKQLQKYKVDKMVGDLDYSLLRHSKTMLTKKELGYCENDVRVVMNYIQESIEAQGNITKLPLTNTGYVRDYCRNFCLYEGSHKKNIDKYLRYHALMLALSLTREEYEQLKRAFQGGFTHANGFYSGLLLKLVASFDFTSSYPAVMIAEQFPMSAAELYEPKDMEDFEKQLSLYCCLFDIEFTGLEAIRFSDHPISVSRCYHTINVLEDNGRVVSADKLVTTITEQDFDIYKKFYKWDGMKIGTFRRYRKGYLPTDFVKAILNLYEKKTTLKGVAGSEEEYLRSKGMLNSCYGMTVTDPCRPEVLYEEGQWEKKACNIEDTLAKYNKNKRRFLFYPWGVWVTAYARHNLFTGIMEFDEDYIYSDTDSVKVLNYEKHMDYINRYNDDITTKIETALNYHGIPLEAAKPKTIKGKEKPLGVWDFEGVYDKFKTLGAKRYATMKDGEFNITVSGVNKKVAVPWLLKKYGEEGVFDAFEDDLYIPAEATGKMTHTYIDEPMEGELTDYQGVKAFYNEKSGIHLEGAEYSLSLSTTYIEYLMGIREKNK